MPEYLEIGTHRVSLEGVPGAILGGWTRKVRDLRQSEIGKIGDLNAEF